MIEWFITNNEINLWSPCTWLFEITTHSAADQKNHIALGCTLFQGHKFSTKTKTNWKYTNYSNTKKNINAVRLSIVHSPKRSTSEHVSALGVVWLTYAKKLRALMLEMTRQVMWNFLNQLQICFKNEGQYYIKTKLKIVFHAHIDYVITFWISFAMPSLLIFKMWQFFPHPVPMCLFLFCWAP